MEGRLSMRPPNLRRRLPMLCVCTFFVGGLIEFIMCSSGFYNVTSVNQGKKEAEKQQKGNDFWMRVKARRKARE
ncbi:hypothetical protein FOZ63_017107, partial [Perkinsus olseni]